MPTSTAISANLENIQAKISGLEGSSTLRQSVRLLAVSKRKPASLIREAAMAGQHCFGENYVDEGVTKIRELTDLHLEWHFIGHIQSNKTRLIASYYDWVQSIDRIKTVDRLAMQRPEALKPLNVCIQVNIDGETTKSGCNPEHIDELAAAVSAHRQLNLRGIMSIPAPDSSTDNQRQVFAGLHKLYTHLRSSYPQVDTLSMGMSGDMESAIAEGATMVRIGTAIFGARD